MVTPAKPTKQFPQPLDRIALGLMLGLSLLVGLLLWSGDRTTPRVREFSWQDKQVGAEDAAFVLNFSRPMNQASVESNLQIRPPLPGKVSWAGRRMVYTLTAPAVYGTPYEVRLQGAQDSFGTATQATNQPFVGQFRSRDRAFAYIGVDGEEQGQLILYNLTQQQKRVLTPKNLTVMDFKIYPLGDRILFSAIDSSSKQPQAVLNQSLYTVTTGIQPQAPQQLVANSSQLPSAAEKSIEPPGEVKLIIENDEYQNMKFDLSPNGQNLVVERMHRQNLQDAGPWLLQLDGSKVLSRAPLALGNQQTGEFIITPDSSAIAIAQGEGLAILPLASQSKPLDFLPKFGMVLDFAKDGSQAAMVQFNKDYTKSLFVVTNQGVQRELLRTNGSIFKAKFDPKNQVLYCLLSRLIPGETYQEQPFLAIVDLKTSKIIPWLILPNQRDIEISLAPDGLALLLDQTVTETKTSQTGLRNDEGKAIATSRLWLLPLIPNDLSAQVKTQPEDLPIAGFHPRWLP